MAGAFITLRKVSGAANARIRAIYVTNTNVAAGTGPITFWSRATIGSGGTTVAATAIGKKNIADANAALEIKTGSIVVTNEVSMMFGGGMNVTTASTAGIQTAWKALDFYDVILLGNEEGLSFKMLAAPASDADNRIAVGIEWEEE